MLEFTEEQRIAKFEELIMLKKSITQIKILLIMNLILNI